MNYKNDLQFIAPTTKRRYHLRKLLEHLGQVIASGNWNELPKEMRMGVCFCGKPFYQKNTRKVYCSDKCRAISYRTKI